MNNQKIDNQLNLAMEIDEENREKSENLDVGFNKADKTWQLIVKYAGSLDNIRSLGVSVVELFGGYAIMTVPEELINLVSESPEIIYIEKPKRLNYSIETGKRVSCINQVQRSPYNLHGQGCIVAVIDSGIDYTNKVFLDSAGETRILELWDQTMEDNDKQAPDGYGAGVLYTREDVNALLKSGAGSQYNTAGSDISGHGTSVASIAAGNFATEITDNPEDDIGIATRSDIIVVKLGYLSGDSYPRTSELMLAVDYCVRRSLYYGRPMAINISIGNNYGSHDGTSLLATYIDNVSSLGRIVIAVGAGNEGSSNTHAGGTLVSGVNKDIEFQTGEFERSFDIQLWKNYSDTFSIEIISPDGSSTGILEKEPGTGKYVSGNTNVFVYYGEPSPYSMSQEVFFEFIPLEDYVDSGTWKIRLVPEIIKSGRYDMWLSSGLISNDTGFLRPDVYTTLTVPSTASSVVTVGAYNAYNFSYGDFSGRGYTRVLNEVKPDIAAPGVNVVCAAPGNVLVERTGTSFAAPFVAGAAALMMEWGITKGNDPFLYGEKAKAYFIKGAKRLSGYTYPNPELGWGVLCLEDSFPQK